MVLTCKVQPVHDKVHEFKLNQRQADKEYLIERFCRVCWDDKDNDNAS